MTLRQARIIAVGDELLNGRTADTNSGRVQRALAVHGLPVAGVEVVPDRSGAIAAALDRTADHELVVLTGGLGSTPDDLTREAVAAWAGRELAEDPELRNRLEERWRRRGLRRLTGLGKQCQVPAGFEPVENPVGSAPALVGEARQRTLILLPGVPEEMAGLLPPVLQKLGRDRALPPELEGRVWRTAQTAELSLVELCRPVRAAHEDLNWSWCLTEWGCDVRVTLPAGAAPNRLESAAAVLDQALGHRVFSRDDVSLPEAVQRLLLERERTVATVESCTGGLIAGRLTDTPGSSACMLGGLVTYTNGLKEQLAGVPLRLLEDHGAVSGEVVAAMAAGGRKKLGADYVLAVSGISGPGGGTGDKPVGTVWLAVATPEAVLTRRYRFRGDRHRNRLLTVAAALDSLRRVLETDDRTPPWREDDTWGRPG